jgi:type IV pilus assembly protein PilC
VRDEVRNGTLLSEGFRQQGIFPKIYVTSVMAGEKSGSLVEVLDRYITTRSCPWRSQEGLASLMYPCVLIVLVICLMVFLVTYVVPTFSHAVRQHERHPAGDDGGSDQPSAPSRAATFWWPRAVAAAVVLFRWWARRDAARETIDASN